ncbi:similar to Saccharomyces cerevisiae YDR456W NHX1 Na+/H+ and K+/H+ exchanger [Geotrichum candidum]|uniref:Sodium/hydrogen exchanger n=1 Tax=Geotrichum candidum TaxID=1173061 RepID=A0A0J9XGP0_GEOCN|nr:similar to Saccharomyces cerevisiae YDR456W NHX1 Na+/H+ and K+/H+ exchanger [Geotrichum candidum]
MDSIRYVGTQVLTSFLRKRDSTDADPDVPDDEVSDPATEEIFTSWAIFILILLIIGSLWTSYYLQKKRIQAVHETVISIFAGMFVGLIIRVSPGHFIQEHVSFSYSYFFNLLLPPIILNSGYELHQANFFRNLATILTFAFLGTFIAAIVLGIILFIWTAIGLEGINISLLDAISVGAALSATDPVTILSIFNAYKVDPKLYTIIFGESLLNDAICIVMFETAQKFTGEDLRISSFFKGVGMFLMTFTISLLIGTIVGILTALLLKHSHIRRFPQIESCLVLLFAYAAYFFSNGCHMSGIVSLLFCGITLKHYAYYNMSRRTQIAVKYIFQLLAQLSENFIFIYLGLSLFTEVELIFKPILIIVTAVGICVSRYAAVFPLSRLINFVHSKRAAALRIPNHQEEIPPPYQMMLFWAGLRGAVGVALAAGLTGEHASSLKATVLVVVVLTVIVFGGTTARMLEILGIRTGVIEEVGSDDEFDIESNVGKHGRPMNYQDGGNNNDELDISDAESDVSDLPPMSSSQQQSQNVALNNISRPDLSSSSLSGIFSKTAEDPGKWFKEFDDQVLKPVLLDSTPSEDPNPNKR